MRLRRLPNTQGSHTGPHRFIIHYDSLNRGHVVSTGTEVPQGRRGGRGGRPELDCGPRLRPIGWAWGRSLWLEPAEGPELKQTGGVPDGTLSGLKEYRVGP